ncbi:hypothetical protein ZHAS_00011097 [Anopheles sinensis]|uniref:Uncharacterized protein n=1 Tax=Anopheles sinensis TaxID=74873 RepID=A0A084VZB6_ANOSI|nr:hypothetical protein ZHAS_00011097 [Anopheles sinensis]
MVSLRRGMPLTLPVQPGAAESGEGTDKGRRAVNGVFQHAPKPPVRYALAVVWYAFLVRSGAFSRSHGFRAKSVVAPTVSLVGLSVPCGTQSPLAHRHTPEPHTARNDQSSCQRADSGTRLPNGRNTATFGVTKII